MFTGWYNPDNFYFNKIIKDNFETIKSEGLQLLGQKRFYDHKQSQENLNSKNTKIANKWKQFSLYDGGAPDRYYMHIQYVPITWNIISSIKEIMNCKHGLVYFSLIPAGGVVVPHKSGLKEKDRIRHQLCLILPNESNPESVYLEVSNEKKSWQLGEIISFDDSYIHKAQNLSEEDRLVLLYDSNPI